MTPDGVLELLERHGLPRDFTPERCGAGFRNEVWFAGDAVVKLYGVGAECAARERWFYENTKTPFAPELLASGDGYIVLERLRGRGLYGAWRGFSERERERSVETLAGIMRSIRGITPDPGLFGASGSFSAAIPDRIAELAESSELPDGLADEVTRYVSENAVYLGGADALVHADLHFDNVIVTPDGLRLIDYEMLERAPADYALDVWIRTYLTPHVYANDSDDPLTLPEDYKSILAWLRRYAPELFADPHVSARAGLYAVLYELHILAKYPTSAEPLERLRFHLRGGTQAALESTPG